MLDIRFSHTHYNALGRIALDEGTEESAIRAITHYENQLEVYEAIGDVEGAATAKINIAIAKVEVRRWHE